MDGRNEVKCWKYDIWLDQIQVSEPLSDNIAQHVVITVDVYLVGVDPT